MDEPDDFLIWPNNIKAWKTFDLVSTQVKVNDRFGCAGFDYVAVEAGLRMAGLAIEPDVFYQLQIIESELIKNLNQKFKNEQ